MRGAAGLQLRSLAPVMTDTTGPALAWVVGPSPRTTAAQSCPGVWGGWGIHSHTPTSVHPSTSHGGRRAWQSLCVSSERRCRFGIHVHQDPRGLLDHRSLGLDKPSGYCFWGPAVCQGLNGMVYAQTPFNCYRGGTILSPLMDGKLKQRWRDPPEVTGQ